MSPNAAARLEAISSDAVPPRGRTSSNRPPLEPLKQQARLGVRIVAVTLGLLPDAAVGLIQIEPAVVVEVDPRRAEARERPAHGSQAGGRGRVAEELAVVAKERVRFAVEVHDQQIFIAVVVDVLGVDAHARLGRAVLVDRRAHHQRLVLEAALAAIDPQLIRHRVVGDEHVGPAVAVDIRDDDAEPVAERRVQPAACETSVNVPLPLLRYSTLESGAS